MPRPPDTAGAETLPSMEEQVKRLKILKAVPSGMRRTRSQLEFKRAVKENPAALALRCDAYDSLLRVAGKIADWADWTTLCSRPTEERLADQLGLSLSTVKRRVRWLREHGHLGTVEKGSKLAKRAALWVLCVPDSEGATDPGVDPGSSPELTPAQGADQGADQGGCTSDPPSGFPFGGGASNPTRTREDRPRRRDPERISPTWGLHVTPRTKRDMLAAAQRLRTESSTLARLSAWYLRWLLKAFFVAGWTPADVLHALDVKGDDSRWTYTWSTASQLRHLPGWMRFRLSAWLERGIPLPSKSQQAAALRDAQRAQQRAWADLNNAMAEASAAGPRLQAPRMSRQEALATAPAWSPAASVDEQALQEATGRGASLARQLLTERGLPTVNAIASRWARSA
ncbi:hypothetical protein ACIBH1_45680 [Nonomuraea sp. NPDC050663]|uniref:hypothetical protein n=1 Tax=Nonomuraea sp. NPDC050663 TaxID=3364370 RepID=UPI0037B121AE